MTKRVEYQVYLEKCFQTDTEPLTFDEWLTQEYDRIKGGF